MHSVWSYTVIYKQWYGDGLARVLPCGSGRGGRGMYCPCSQPRRATTTTTTTTAATAISKTRAPDGGYDSQASRQALGRVNTWSRHRPFTNNNTTNNQQPTGIIYVYSTLDLYYCTLCVACISVLFRSRFPSISSPIFQYSNIPIFPHLIHPVTAKPPQTTLLNHH